MTDSETKTGLPRRVTTLVALGALACILPLAASQSEAQSASGGESLERAVVSEMHGGSETGAYGTAAATSGAEDQVNVRKTDGPWAFGTAVTPAPQKRGAYPQGWLFVAERTPAGWEVGLEGSPEFSQLAQEAPQAVVDDQEKGLFAHSGDAPSGEFAAQGAGFRLRLPWVLNRGWTMSGGPHGWSTGYDRPYSALDFNGGDERVRAAGAGKAYVMCNTNRGWIRVVHANGYATDYYHLARNIKPRDGVKRVEEGQFLGYTGTDVSCGGKAYGRHVHFGLRRNGAPIALDGRVAGGWKFHEGSAYGGYATHNDRRRDVGNRLRNFG